MTSRRNARRAAVDVLYQADVTGADPRSVMDEWAVAGRDLPPFTRELVEGVAANGPELDTLIGDHAQEWSVERLAAVDRTILRVATYELVAREDVPTGAAINEAVQAANELSTARSGKFVNGVLGRIAIERRGAEPAGPVPSSP